MHHKSGPPFERWFQLNEWCPPILATLHPMKFASAPGKVLLTGGYLILDQPHSGLVLSTSARFFASAVALRDDGPENDVLAQIEVWSPQLQRRSVYSLSLPGLDINPDPGFESAGNKFVEKSVQFAIGAALALQEAPADHMLMQKKLAEEGLSLVIQGDNAFYSQRHRLDPEAPLSSAVLLSLPPFAPVALNDPHSETPTSGAPEIAKTGLGSSAAMVTAVVAAVLYHLQAVDLAQPSQDSLRVIHRVAQAAHCAAQGKVGSGFDVSAAVYGSQHYVRFSPACLATPTSSVEGANLEEVAGEILKSEWDGEVATFALPPGLLLMVGEPGRGGTSTPSMVGAVNRWRKQSEGEASALWTELGEANREVEESLSKLSKLASESRTRYDKVLEMCTHETASQWVCVTGGDPEDKAIAQVLQDASEAFRRVRRGLQGMSSKAGVAIEPPEQTQVLDATMALPGVLFAGVPGAGGYDAVFAVVIGKRSWEGVDSFWGEAGILTLDTSEDPEGVRMQVEENVREAV